MLSNHHTHISRTHHPKHLCPLFPWPRGHLLASGHHHLTVNLCSPGPQAPDSSSPEAVSTRQRESSKLQTPPPLFHSPLLASGYSRKLHTRLRLPFRILAFLHLGKEKTCRLTSQIMSPATSHPEKTKVLQKHQAFFSIALNLSYVLPHPLKSRKHTYPPPVLGDSDSGGPDAIPVTHPTDDSCNTAQKHCF